MNARKHLYPLALLCASALAACGGSSGGGDSASAPPADGGGTSAPARAELPAVSQIRGLYSGPNARAVMAVKTDGTVYGWGMNQSGELGLTGPTVERTPIQIYGLQADVDSMVLGFWNAFAIGQTTPAYAFGFNGSGILGDGTTLTRISPVRLISASTPTSTFGVPFKSIAVSTDFSVGVHMSNGSLFGWGSGLSLGAARPYNVNVIASGGYQTVSAGYGFVVALKTDGTVMSFGKIISEGQLGRPTLYDSLGGVDTTTPVAVMTGVVRVWCGISSAYALKADGTLWAWGRNVEGQLGDGTFTQRNLPVQIATDFVTLSASSAHVVALKADGSLWAWGSNNAGQLADGSFTNSPTPKKIGTGFALALAGPGATLAATPQGDVYGAGTNQYGVLGLGTDSSLRGNFTTLTKSLFSGAYQPPAPPQLGTGSSGSDGDALNYPQINHTFSCQLGGGQVSTKTVPVSNGPCVSQQKAYMQQVTCNNLDADLTVKSTARPFYQCAVNNSTGDYKTYYQQYLSYY